MKHFFSLIFFSCLISSAMAEMISSTNFESLEAGSPMLRSDWQNEGFTTGTWDAGLMDRTVIDDSSLSVSGTNSLRIKYPQGGYGPTETGAQVQLKFDKRDEAYTSYWLRFSEDFSYGTTNEGGKLPGLSGGDDCSGGDSCDGTNGFSARFMWRTGGAIVLYLYHMDKPATYGEDHYLKHADGSNVTIKKGEWIHIAERVKMNTDGDTYDGEVQAWVNGEEVLFLKGLRFTNNGDKIDKVYISTFHGGSDNTWAPKNDCYIWLDDIRIGTTYEDVAIQKCSQQQLGQNRSLCTESEITLSAQSEEGEITTWRKNGELFSKSPTITVTESGSYTLIVDSAWCSQKETVEIFDGLVADLGEDRHICETSFVELSSNLSHQNLKYAWEKDGVPLASNESSIKIKDAGKYKLTLSSENCESVSDEIVVTSGLLPVEDISGNEGENVTLKIQGESNYAWYDADGTLVGEGNNLPFTLPNGTETLFVKDMEAFSGYVGMKRTNESFIYSMTNFEERKMKFEVFSPLTIDSITIYPKQAQDITVRIVGEDLTTVFSEVSYPNTSAGEQRIALNATLQPGVYHMDALGSTGALLHSHEGDTAVKFPYTLDGKISILGSNVAWINNKPWYLCFYNWKVSAGNQCAATPVFVEGKSSTALPNTNASTINVFPTITNDLVYIDGLSDQYNIQLFDEVGNNVGFKLEKVGDRHQMRISKKGIFLLKVNDTIYKIIKQ